MGREERVEKKFWVCPYCKEKGKERKVYRPEEVIGHLFIYILKNGEVDCHGPLSNTQFMKVVFKYLKAIIRRYEVPWWKKVWLRVKGEK